MTVLLVKPARCSEGSVVMSNQREQEVEETRERGRNGSRERVREKAGSRERLREKAGSRERGSWQYPPLSGEAARDHCPGPQHLTLAWGRGR